MVTYISQSNDLYSWSSEYALYLKDYLMEKCLTLDISSMGQQEWSQNTVRSV